MNIGLTSVEILMGARGLRMADMVQVISREAYYDLVKAERNARDVTLQRIDELLDAKGCLPVLHQLDRLWVVSEGRMKLQPLSLGNNIPKDIQDLILLHHPLFATELRTNGAVKSTSN